MCQSTLASCHERSHSPLAPHTHFIVPPRVSVLLCPAASVAVYSLGSLPRDRGLGFAPVTAELAIMTGASQPEPAVEVIVRELAFRDTSSYVSL